MAGSHAAAFKAALFTACQGLYPNALVTYGHPGSISDADIIGVLDISSVRGIAPMGTNRPREELLTATLLFSCWSGGTDQQAVTERAFALVAQFEAYLQDAGNSPSSKVNLGGAVRFAQITATDCAESHDPAVLATGRVAEVTVTVVANARY